MAFDGEIRIVPHVPAAFAELVTTEAPRSIALSGGDTARACYTLFATAANVDWSRVEVLFGDERWVPIHDPDSNEGMARLAFLDEVEPAWLGYSVGRWEADTFVVEGIGFRDRGWLSAREAYPNSDALRVIERWNRVDFGHMRLTVTIDDPKAYLKPWTNTIPLELLPDTELLDSYCDNQMNILKTWSIDPPPAEPPSR